MERVYLLKDEKAVLWHLYAGNRGIPQNLPESLHLPIVYSLQQKGFVNAQFSATGNVLFVKLTPYAKLYAYMNPRLRNPIPWSKIGAIASIITALATVAALFVGCTYINTMS